RMAERVVGLACHAGEVGIGKRAADERRDDLAGGLGVRLAGERRNPIRGKNRPFLRHIEPAVAGKAGERDIDEALRGCLPAGRDVAQELVPFRSTAAGLAERSEARWDTGRRAVWLVRSAPSPLDPRCKSLVLSGPAVVAIAGRI